MSMLFDLKYLTEAYKSKYASYFDNDDMDDEDEDDDDDEDEEEETKTSSKDKSSNNKDDKKEDTAPKAVPKPLTHLQSRDLYRIIDIAKNTVNKFPKLKKCFDYVDISDKCEIDDEGRRASALDLYRQKSVTAYIKLIEGDVWSGYPDFKDGGSDTFEDDAKAYVKAVNEKLVEFGIMAKFVNNHDNNDEAISFGVKSFDITKKSKKEDDD